MNDKFSAPEPAPRPKPTSAPEFEGQTIISGDPHQIAMIEQLRGNIGLTLRTPQPPTVRIDPEDPGRAIITTHATARDRLRVLLQTDWNVKIVDLTDEE